MSEMCWNLQYEDIAMRKDFTLPDLQSKLDLLESGGQFQVLHVDVERLFGMDDVARARLLRFAQGHGCLTVETDTGVTFRRVAEARATHLGSS